MQTSPFLLHTVANQWTEGAQLVHNTIFAMLHAMQAHPSPTTPKPWHKMSLPTKYCTVSSSLDVVCKAAPAFPTAHTHTQSGRISPFSLQQFRSAPCLRLRLGIFSCVSAPPPLSLLFPLSSFSFHLVKTLSLQVSHSHLRISSNPLLPLLFSLSRITAGGLIVLLCTFPFFQPSPLFQRPSCQGSAPSASTNSTHFLFLPSHTLWL